MVSTNHPFPCETRFPCELRGKMIISFGQLFMDVGVGEIIRDNNLSVK